MVVDAIPLHLVATSFEHSAMFGHVWNLQCTPLLFCSSYSDSSIFLHPAKCFTDSRSTTLGSITAPTLLRSSAPKNPPLVATYQTVHAYISVVYGNFHPKCLEPLHNPTEHGWWILVLLYKSNIYHHGLPFFWSDSLLLVKSHGKLAMRKLWFYLGSETSILQPKPFLQHSP